VEAWKDEYAARRNFGRCHRSATAVVSPIRHGLPNTRDKLRSSIACAGFVSFIPLFDGLLIWTASEIHRLRPTTNALVGPRDRRHARALRW
jgi:hypothetical protein